MRVDERTVVIEKNPFHVLIVSQRTIPLPHRRYWTRTRLASLPQREYGAEPCHTYKASKIALGNEISGFAPKNRVSWLINCRFSLTGKMRVSNNTWSQDYRLFQSYLNRTRVAVFIRPIHQLTRFFGSFAPNSSPNVFSALRVKKRIGNRIPDTCSMGIYNGIRYNANTSEAARKEAR